MTDRLAGGRTCESCSARMPDMMHRQRGEDGALLCPSCARQTRPEWATTGSRHVAHGGGEDETLSHCPRCGSGQIVGGADGTISCGFCDFYFTVQSQPRYPAMPQTIDGQAIDPLTGQPAPEPTEPLLDLAQEAQEPPQDEQQEPEVPQAPPVPPRPPAPPQPPRRALYVVEGVAVGEDVLVRRLALRHADHRAPVLEQVRRDNGA